MQSVRQNPPSSGLPSALHSAQPPLGVEPSTFGLQDWRCTTGLYRGLLWTSAFSTSAWKTQAPFHDLASTGSRHANICPIPQDTIHGNRVHGEVVAQPTASKRKKEQIGEGEGGERCTLLSHERCTQPSDEPPSMGDLRRASGGYFELPSYHLHCIVPIPHWGLNRGPSVYKIDALPQSYRCFLC